jgi:mycothiol synthase
MINRGSYTIRNYSDDDFDKYFQLQIESEKLEPAGRFISAQGLSDYLGRPNFTPQKDLFVAELNEFLIGWLGLVLEPGIGRALLDGLVHPLHRRKGIANELVAAGLQRVKEAGIKSAQVSILETNAPARGFLKRLGFTFIREFFEMRLNIEDVRFPAARQGPTTSRRLKNGEEALLTELQNRCFGDSWGFNPNTTEEIAYRLNMHGRCSDDVTLTFLEDTPVGYCWIIIDAEANATRKKNKGLIHMMGVDSNYRQQEIGKVILLNGLRELKDRGVDSVELTVDSENHAACSLYESVGFAVYEKTKWYEKIVD